MEVDKINIKEVRRVWENIVWKKEELKVNMGRYTLYIILSYFNSIGRWINRTVYKSCIEKYSGSVNNQITNMLSFARDSV